MHLRGENLAMVLHKFDKYFGTSLRFIALKIVILVTFLKRTNISKGTGSTQCVGRLLVPVQTSGTRLKINK